MAGAAFFVVVALEVEAFFAAGAFLVEALALVAVEAAGFAVDMMIEAGDGKVSEDTGAEGGC